MGRMIMAKVEDNSELHKALKRVKIAEKIRFISLLLSLVLVLLVFYGNKFAVHVPWFVSSRTIIYNILFVIILILLGATISKIFLAAKYNQILKKMDDN